MNNQSETDLKVATRLVLNEARKRGWEAEVLIFDENIISITLPSGRKLILRYSLSNFSGGMGYVIASEKKLTYPVLRSFGIPVPATLEGTKEESAVGFLKEHGKIVVKPSAGSKGEGVITGITTKEELDSAIMKVSELGDTPVLQEHVEGNEYRFLVINGECVAVLHREPASIIGDGTHTIGELILLENESDNRQLRGFTSLKPIDAEGALRFLGNKYDSVPANGEKVFVIDTSNISRGGTSIDATDTAHTELKQLAVKACSMLGLRVAGVDIICTAVDKALNNSGARIIEIEENPGLRIHHFPNVGQPRDVTAKLLDAFVRMDEE